MPEYRIGLDLGRKVDHSVAVVAERVMRETGFRRENVFGETWPEVEDVFIVRAAKMWPLGVLFSDVIEDVGKISAIEEFAGKSVLIFDEGGVGGGSTVQAIDTAYRRGFLHLDRRPIGITTTAGREGQTAGTKSKTQLVDRLVTLITSNRIRVDDQMPGGLELQKELEAFAPKTTVSGYVGYEAKGSAHDDHVAALALATYHQRRKAGRSRWLEVHDGEEILVDERWQDRR